MAKAKKKTAKKKTTKKATKKKTAKKAAKKSKEMILVLSKTKEALRGKGYNVSGDAIEALNDLLWSNVIPQAQAACDANGRKTIRPYDILA